jgi:hypothetical protein
VGEDVQEAKEDKEDKEVIFPDISKDEWMERHPGIKAIEVECLECHGWIPVEKPFLTRDYAGLAASECPNCKAPYKAYTGVPHSQKELHAWYSGNARAAGGSKGEK